MIQTVNKDAIAAAINAMPPDPELERLRAENEALKQSIRHESDVVEAAREEIIRQRVENAKQSEKIDALIAENEALRKDAERYRMVRRGQKWSVINGIGDALRGPDLDDAIDAALQEPKP